MGAQPGSTEWLYELQNLGKDIDPPCWLTNSYLLSSGAADYPSWRFPSSERAEACVPLLEAKGEKRSLYPSPKHRLRAQDLSVPRDHAPLCPSQWETASHGYLVAEVGF